MKLNNFLKLVIAVVISEAAGIIGSAFTVSSVSTWYTTLQKPSFNPPNWIFGPVWTALYFLMGVAAFLVWRRGFERKEVKTALAVFGGQLALNAFWSIIFFGLRNPFWAFIEIIILWLAILLTIVSFYKISKTSACLLLPYIIWVSFAGYLNYSIWQLQANAPEPVACTAEAKLCPDGSYVARIPPECEFAPCPKENLIQVEAPGPNEVISSPLIIKGKARGFWFFEASFPIKLFDENGELLTVAVTQAKSDWMTEDFVRFEAELKFETPETERGTLVLEKDNPSGLPENADELKIPVAFAEKKRMVKLYYYNYEMDRDEFGNIACSRNGLVAVEREIPMTQTPIQDTIKLLLRGRENLTQEEIGRGITTEYPLEELSLAEVNLKEDGALLLKFSDPLNRTSGGACRAGILWFQIEATAKQFPGVKKVQFLPEELFQP